MFARVRHCLSHLRTRLGAERLRVSAEAVSYRWPLRRRRTIVFRDLVELRLKTTDQGPIFEDVFWVLIAAKPGGGTVTVLIPTEFDTSNQLRDRLMDLPGFNHEAMIDAMTCVNDREFVCWRMGDRASLDGRDDEN